MTLVKQIKDIHSRHFNPEFHEYRKDIIPAMVNDLKMKFFDNLQNDGVSWFTLDCSDIRAVRKASEMIHSCGLRIDTPAEK